MALLAVDNDLPSDGIQLDELLAHLLLQREHHGAGSIDELDITLACHLIDRRRLTMRTEEDALAL